MSTEYIKLFTPVLIMFFWFVFALRVQKPALIGASLYFASFAACSSNFTFVYREIYQYIQIILILMFIFPAMKHGRLHKINWILLVFLCFIGISLFYVPFDTDAKSQLINYLVVVGVVNYLILSISTEYDIDKIFNFLATLTILLTCIGLVEFLINPGLRIEATFSNPNYYGFFLGIGFCIVASRIYGIKRNIALAFILLALLATGSRSAVVFPVIYFLYKTYIVKKNYKKLAYTLVLFAIIALGLNLGISRFSAKEQIASSDAERRIFASIALKMAYENPLTGVGWGRFINEFSRYSSRTEKIAVSSGFVDLSKQERRVSHNDYLRVLAELGWIAFVAFIILTLYGIKLVFTNTNCLLINFPPIWLGSVFFSLSHNNLNNALFWFIFLYPFVLNREPTWQETLIKC